VFFVPCFFAQLCQINIDTKGNFEAVISTEQGTITVSSTGEVLEVGLEGDVSYIHSNYINGGKVKRIGQVDFSYIHTNYANGGKIKRIGSIDFSYIHTNYANGGKIRQIGDFDFSYIYTNYANGGKIKRIGNTDISYIYPNYANGGKLKRIGNDDFSYVYPNYANGGKLKSGRRSFMANGIRFKVKFGGVLDCAMTIHESSATYNK